MEIIERPAYLSHIISHLGKGMMIILVGQRRVGKSCMLKQLQAWLRINRPAANIAYVDKELHAFKGIATADDLYGYATANLPERGDNYLLIDEVQDITDYEDALRSLHAENRCQVVATGSNAYIFSSELSTRLSGRYVEIPIHSLTYKGFLRFHGLQDTDKSLQFYLRVGGLPGLCRRGGHLRGQLPADGLPGRGLPRGVCTQCQAGPGDVRGSDVRGFRRAGRSCGIHGVVDPDHQRVDDQEREPHLYVRAAAAGGGYGDDRSRDGEGRRQGLPDAAASDRGGGRG